MYQKVLTFYMASSYYKEFNRKASYYTNSKLTERKGRDIEEKEDSIVIKIKSVRSREFGNIRVDTDTSTDEIVEEWRRVLEDKFPNLIRVEYNPDTSSYEVELEKVNGKGEQHGLAFKGI